MTAAAGSATRAPGRPTTIVALAWTNIICNLAFFGTFLLPGADEIPGAAIVFAVIAGVISILLTWPVWKGMRWGAIALAIVTGLNGLSALPGLLDPPSGEIAASIVVGVVASIAILWLLFHPDSRRFYRGA